MIVTPRTRYLTEVEGLTSRFEELAGAFKPVPGEIDTMIVPVSVMRRLMQFCESNLSRLQKVAEFLPDEDLAEILAASADGEPRGAPTPIPAEDVVQWTD
jgi:hypothetical protein